MKHLILLSLLLFSTFTYADDYGFKGTDFAPFPLSTGDVSLIEGVWRGDMIDIRIENSGSSFFNKPIYGLKSWTTRQIQLKKV